ncbi:MAG: hypothetical protein K2K14_00380 [Ruminococcus sp.]|nr:hypothetical protein [Ruminococcus sp.]
MENFNPANNIRKDCCAISEKFDVIREYERNISLNKLINKVQPTQHMKKSRQKRYEQMIKCLDENDKIEKVFVVDTGAYNGEELHCITHSGIVFILNREQHEDCPYTGLITILIARVNQLDRYGYQISEYTRQKAKLHEQQGLNYV